MPEQQLSLALIPHQAEGFVINQRAIDGYIHATALCNATGKQWNHYWSADHVQAFVDELSKETGIPKASLAYSSKGSGTWVHPQVAIHLAQWLSPKFAVQVTKWVAEWMAGGGSNLKGMPIHLQRYMVNRKDIPATHFSMLNELVFGLVAPLEAEGYSLPENMMPDISEGRMFCKWLREEKGVEPNTFPTYKHRFMDGRVVDAKLYPNELLADFRAHFHGTWLPKKATQYFAERDVKALPHLPKLLANAS